MEKVNVGDFIVITKRKVADSVQPLVKLKGVYSVAEVGKLKNGKTVLTLWRNQSEGQTLRANEERFEWKKLKIKIDNRTTAKEAIGKNLTRDDQQEIFIRKDMILHLAWAYVDDAIKLIDKYAGESGDIKLVRYEKKIEVVRTKYKFDAEHNVSKDYLRKMDQCVKDYVEENEVHLKQLKYAVINAIYKKYPNEEKLHLKVNTYIAMKFIDLYDSSVAEASKELSEKMGSKIVLKKQKSAAELRRWLQHVMGLTKVEDTFEVMTGMRVARVDVGKIKISVS